MENPTSMNSGGILKDLLAISTVVKTIKQDIASITKSAETATTGISKLKGGSRTSGSGSGFRTGNGNSALAAVSSGSSIYESGPGGGMAGLGKISAGSTGYTATMVAGKIGLAAVSAISSGLPDVGKTISNSSTYFRAAMAQGGLPNYRNMQAATESVMQQGGMTDPATGAQMAMQLSSMGVNFSSQSNSEWMNTVRGAANASKYLGMDPLVAAQSIAGLTTGSMSTNLRRMGIMTSSPNGTKLSMQDIFTQLKGRVLKPGAHTVDQINDAYNRGALKSTLEGSGLSSDQQELFLSWLKADASGQKMDLSDQKSVDAAMAAMGKNGNVNPELGLQKINASESKTMAAASDTYIKAINDAVGPIQTLNAAAAEAARGLLGYSSALGKTISGTNAGGSLLGFVGDSASGIAQGVGAFSMFKGAKGLLGKLGGGIGTGEAAMGATAASSTSTFLKGAAPLLKGAGKFLGAAGAVLNTGIVADETSKTKKSGGDPWANFWNEASTAALTGAGTGALAGLAGGPFAEVSVPAGALIGGALGFGSVLGGKLLGNAAGASAGAPNVSATTGSISRARGESSTPNNTETKLTFKLPVQGTIGDRFGNRDLPENPYHNGLDIVASAGTPIGASADGEVVFVGQDYGRDGTLMGGNTVKVKHSNGMVTWYCHMQDGSFAVSVGAKVSQGDKLGSVGRTGMATGDHCHFGVWAGGGFIDPETVLDGSIVTVSSSGTKKSSSTTTSSTSSTSSDPHLARGMGMAGTMSLNSIMDLRATSAPKSVPGISGSKASSSAAVRAMGTQTSSKAQSSKSSMGIYNPKAKRAKEGDPYVTNDGPVNVHAGEAILTAEQADVWRNEMRGISKKSGGNNVTINVHIASASESEARKFAKLVKSYIEEDSFRGSMGAH
jgi:murein DD-endopeptidase MepM/ murein hydrolase activator NlpD